MARLALLSVMLTLSALISACGGLNNDADLGENQPYRLKLVDAPTSIFAGDCNGNFMSIQVVQKSNDSSIFVNEDIVVTARGYSGETEIENSVFLQSSLDCNGSSSSTTIENGEAESLIYLQVNRVEVNRITLSNSNSTVAGAEITVQVLPNFVGAIALDNLPTSAVTNTAFNPAPQLQLTDAWGNIILDETANITVDAYLDSICITPASGALTGNTDVTTSTGALTLPNVRYSLPSIIYLKAFVSGDGTIASECKGPITVTAP